MKSPQILKLYISNFLTGLVFWYGVEKLFMRSIGIDAVGVGAATAVFLVFNLIFDIPAGILADRWSRKGVLAVSALALAVCSVLLGSSHGLLLYAFGEVFYGMYIVSTSGTYNAIIYDSLYEEKRTAQYSRISGRAYALFLAGAGVANIASGFIAQHFGYRTTYFITVVSCVLNGIVIMSLREPRVHKLAQKERMLGQLRSALSALSRIKLIRALTLVLTALAVTELFKSEFGQLYMVRYFSSSQAIGLLWSAYAFTWSLGSLIAHRFRARLDALIICTVVPFVLMAFIDNWFSLVLFMVQAVAAAAFINQTETRIQEETPSSVRASILSVIATMGRLVSVPFSFVLGWVLHRYDALVAVRFVAVIALLTLMYWLLVSRRLPKINDPVRTAEEPLVV